MAFKTIISIFFEKYKVKIDLDYTVLATLSRQLKAKVHRVDVQEGITR